jgi:hypothetical protein
MQRMKSRAARMVLGRKRKNWSYTEGMRELKWLSVPQMAVEATIRGALKVLQAGKPENLYESLVNDDETLKHPSEASLNNMKKMRSRTWQIRAQRYLKIIPEGIRKLNVKTPGGKKKLKNVRKIKGDKIFGRVLKPRPVRTQARG